MALAVAPAAVALPDFDGDGSVPPQDCAPLDPAVHPGAVDTPDVAFEDTNCDGIDGDAGKAVFVTLGGSDVAPGSVTNPKRTIQAAVDAASTAGKDVYIAGGEFDETVSLKNNVGLYGGYEPITGRRSAEQATLIKGAPAVLAVGNQGVRLLSLTLQGVPDGAGNAYGLRAVPNGATPSRLALERVTTQGLTAQSGANGLPGAAGFDAGGFGGGIGGAGGCGVGDPGGSGGDGGGSAGIPPTPSPGANNPFLLVDQPTWPRPLAAASVGGGDGGGGDGGHGGRGVTLVIEGERTPLCGGTGGNGGAGGGGGLPGGPGQNGAGSFGAYLFDSSLVAVDSTFTGGTAGSGGNGGNGGVGGSGSAGDPGEPGECATEQACAPSGGDGGSGGTGGRGGGGGAGAGGPSAGVYQAGAGSGYAAKGSTSEQAAAGALGGTQGDTLTRAQSGEGAGRLRSATAPALSAADFDGDGITDSVDNCPADTQGAGSSNGCPARPDKLSDRDGDAIPDGADACRDTPRGTNDANEDGCPDAAVDNDHDGFSASQDCNDNDPTVRPNARDIPGNRIDENCDGIAAPFRRVGASVTLGVLFGRNFILLKTLRVASLKRGDRVKLSCKGRGCRRSLHATIPIKRKTRLLSLNKRVRGVRLRKRARLQVRVSHRGLVAKIVRFTVKRFGEVPVRKELCQPPGAKRPRRC